MTPKKNPAAVALGRKGGAAKTKAQTEARRKVMAQINAKKKEAQHRGRVEMSAGYTDRFCEKCGTYTQHYTLVKREKWQCLGCKTVSERKGRVTK